MLVLLDHLMAVSDSSVLEVARRAGREMCRKSSATGGVPMCNSCVVVELGIDVDGIPSLASKGGLEVALEVVEDKYHEGWL